MPTGAAIALATGELMVAARRTVTALPADAAPVAVVAEIRSALGQFWPRVPPEAVRDVLISAAELAAELGVTQMPDDLSVELAERYPGQLDGADGMLELTAEWITAGKPTGPGGFTPPAAFASSVAFDRAEDEETLTSLAALLAVSHLALAEREAAERDDFVQDRHADLDPNADEAEPEPWS